MQSGGTVINMGKRVLVCSVMCWNKETGSDTFSSLMQGYDTNNLANLYIREGIPDSAVCNNYFKISESKVIKSVIFRGLKTGTQISANCTEATKMIDEDAPESERIYSKYGKKKSLFKLIARELLWKFGKWKTKELDSFLEEFKPEVVFFAMEGYIHFININKYILKKTHAKGIAYFWDDNFTYKQSSGLGFRAYRFLQRRTLKQAAKLCDSFFAISPKTKREADEVFNINCEVLTKPIDFQNLTFKEYTPSRPIKMLYTGKLIIGRYDTVKLIGNVIDEINKDDVKIELDIYTTTKDLDVTGLSKYVHILGSIPQSEISKVQSNADILLFAEAIEGRNSKTARLSFSTKLTDYFKSGKCILAVGNYDIAPIEYLREENAALIANNYSSVFNVLSQVINNRSIITEYAERAFDVGKKNHDKNMIQKRLFDKFN